MDYTSHDCIFLDIPERSEIWNRGDNVLHVIDNKYTCNYRSYGKKVNLVLKKQICKEYFLQIYISFRSYKIHNKTKSSPGVTGAASEHPLEGVAEDPRVGYTENAHSLSGRDYKGWVGAGARGIPPPSSYGPSAGSGTLHLFNACVVFLKALHSTMAVPCSGDALDGVVGTGERRDVRHLVLDGGLADSAFVLDGVALCPRRVDDEVHLLVQDDVKDVRAAFGDLVHHFALDAGLLVELGGTFGSVNLEAELLEFLTDFDGLFRQVNLVGEANQHGTFVREEGTCGFLAFVVSEGVVVGEAEDFAGGAHFGAENRVNLGELVEGEHSFLSAVVVELLVLELQVRELGTEHKAGSEAGLWRPFGLQPHSRLRRLVKTSRLRLTGVLQTLETRGTVRGNPSSGVTAQKHIQKNHFMLIR